MNPRKPKWAFKVLAVVETSQGTKVETFENYQFARNWTKTLGGGVVYPIDLITDYTPTSVTLKEGMSAHRYEHETDSEGQLEMFT